MKKEVTIKYTLGHSYSYTYQKSNLYCPSCGRQSVWVEDGSGDFYEGVDYACTSCKASFTLPSLGTNNKSFEGKQLIEQLRS